jgi:hypothetical protein
MILVCNKSLGVRIRELDDIVSYIMMVGVITVGLVVQAVM